MVWAMALLAGALPATAAESGWKWRETMTPHFQIKHEEAFLPPGMTMGVERIHGRLRLDLGSFSPWMAKERLNLYVYADQESYLAGEFSPPKWSNGLAIYERKAVAVPAMPDSRKLLQVLAHEGTHLLFESWWREANVQPPAWLNEGLAMLEEAESPEKPETSQWYQAMSMAVPAKFQPLETFFGVSPIKDLHGDQNAVQDWYIQAYSVVHFLMRKHSKLQFKGFCTQLRDGKPVAEALWLSYRYRNVADMDKKWRLWLADPVHARRIAALTSAQRVGVDESVTKRLDKVKGKFKPYELYKPGPYKLEPFAPAPIGSSSSSSSKR